MPPEDKLVDAHIELVAALIYATDSHRRGRAAALRWAQTLITFSLERIHVLLSISPDLARPDLEDDMESAKEALGFVVE
ncbi:hypothetical protein [Fimbriiglobus ruber]|uniref:hypothetical protein n=1 Tax=Fimbriiglobus ruber TaxID=1908690 RepID=UPI001179E164|nr:hypothetical protein [Fimbriiglobus ruber]